jgi:hypothetical protein
MVIVNGGQYFNNMQYFIVVFSKYFTVVGSVNNRQNDRIETFKRIASIQIKRSMHPNTSSNMCQVMDIDGDQ